MSKAPLQSSAEAPSQPSLSSLQPPCERNVLINVERTAVAPGKRKKQRLAHLLAKEGLHVDPADLEDRRPCRRADAKELALWLGTSSTSRSWSRRRAAPMMPADVVAEAARPVTGRWSNRPTATVMLLRALIVSLPVALVWPSSTAGGYFTGSQLLEFCTSQNAILRSACLAYVEGAVDLLNDVQEDLPTKSKVCVPAGMGGEQVVDIMVRYLQAHPEKRQYTAAQEVVLALLQALPCPPN